MHKISLCGVARTCDKIEAVLTRKLIDPPSHFTELDPKASGLISEAKFFTVVYCQLGHEFGVCQEEVKELSDYFKKEDGQVAYREFLQLVSPCHDSKKSFVSGLEWEDHRQVNVLSPFELKHLNLILTKIAQSCHVREIHLEPHFKDYERVSGGNGAVTILHFRRILNFVGITLATKEFQLLVKRFSKHSYLMNYVAFLEVIREIIEWFDKNGFLDCDKKFKQNMPGRIIVADIDSLPRPEVGKVDVAAMFGTRRASHPCIEQNKKCNMKLEELMIRIKKHIYDNQIRTREFFEIFDDLRRGFITKSQFHRGLDAIGLSGLHRMFISKNDHEQILKAYSDPNDPNRLAWSKFCDDIDEVFTIKSLDKQPYRVVESPQVAVRNIHRPGAADWNCVKKSTKTLAQQTLFRLRDVIKSRRIFIETFFKDHDKSNSLHVSRCQMQRVFGANSILISEREVQALMARYGDDMGFNYWKFLREINEIAFCESKHQEILKLLRLVNEKKSKSCDKADYSIIEVLAKIKGQVTRNRINIEAFLNEGEKLNLGAVPESKFRSSFSTAGIKLDECELDILCEAFKSPFKSGYICFKSFAKLINEAFLQTELEKQPLRVPIQHIPSPDDCMNFLSFEERCIVSSALQKLARYHDNYSNMKCFFEDRVGRDGSVSEDGLKQVLTICGGLMELISEKELETVFKCFSREAGKERKIDYRNFLAVLSLIQEM